MADQTSPAIPDEMLPVEVLLSVDVPPVTEEIKELLVRCGHTTVVVREDHPNAWRVWTDGYFVTQPRHDDYEAAVTDAHVWARNKERDRLLSNRLTEVLQNWAAVDARPWRRPSCEACDRGLCAVGAEDPCPGCCACVGHCLGDESGEDGESS